MRIFIFISLVFLFNDVLIAQQEAAIWYFGNQAGLDFNSGEPVAITNSRMNAEAGCAVISDKTGQLQFYTDGNKIWDKEHQIMPNGFGLKGSQKLNQNTLIVPLSGSADIYYLFTVNADFDTIGMNYSVLDMRLNDSLGDVVMKNQLLSEGVVEKLTGARHCNGRDIWIVAHDRFDGYYSYLLSADSLNKTPVISRTGNNVRADIGYMKMSPASSRIAMPVNNSVTLVELCRFQNRTGKVFDPVRILPRDSVIYAYGIEFSPDGNLLYISTGGRQYKLWQYDITLETEQEINNSAKLIATGNNFALQLASNEKLYIAKENSNELNSILAPDKNAPDCDYRKNDIGLAGGLSLKGLPNFLPFYFYNPRIPAGGLCHGDTTFFSFPQYLNSDSLTWDFGDGSSPLTTKQIGNIHHLYPDASTYQLELLVHHCGISDTITRTVNIQNPPVVFLGNDTTICGYCTIKLNGGDGMDDWLWQDGSRLQYYEVKNAGSYSVTVWKNGCTATDTIKISRVPVNVYMPNAFTPNGDGINDFFAPVIAEPLENYHLIIFNRSGKVIFESYNTNVGWDGYFRGKPENIGVYSWKIIYSVSQVQNYTENKKTGTVLLLR